MNEEEEAAAAGEDTAARLLRVSESARCSHRVTRHCTRVEHQLWHVGVSLAAEWSRTDPRSRVALLRRVGALVSGHDGHVAVGVSPEAAWVGGQCCCPSVERQRDRPGAVKAHRPQGELVAEADGHCCG